MLREISNRLSGGQITLIILAAILVPGTVTAAVVFQPVAIVDPTSGKQSYVDNGRKLWVYDPIAGYRNNPATYVRIAISSNGSQCETNQQYVIPAGKSLILTAITGYLFLYGNSNFAGYHLLDGAGCTSSSITSNIASVSSASPAVPVAVDLGTGIVVAAGKTLSLRSVANQGPTYLHGYLVPAGAFPAMASAEGEAQVPRIEATEVAAKTHRR